MKKVISVTIKNVNGSNETTRVNDLKELNDHLAEGWEVRTVDFVTSNTTATFTAMYLLEKR